MSGLFLGIDPGLKGGIAAIPGAVGIEPRAWAMPTSGNEVCPKKLLADLKYYVGICQPSEVLCALEWAQAMPKQGVCAMFNYGMGFGMLRGVLAALCIPYVLVRPTTWKKVILADTPKDKQAAIDIVRRRFPGVSLYRTAGSTKESDGLADALCLALYAQSIISHPPGDKR